MKSNTKASNEKFLNLFSMNRIMVMASVLLVMVAHSIRYTNKTSPVQFVLKQVQHTLIYFILEFLR